MQQKKKPRNAVKEREKINKKCCKTTQKQIKKLRNTVKQREKN